MIVTTTAATITTKRHVDADDNDSTMSCRDCDKYRDNLERA